MVFQLPVSGSFRSCCPPAFVLGFGSRSFRPADADAASLTAAVPRARSSGRNLFKISMNDIHEPGTARRRRAVAPPSSPEENPAAERDLRGRTAADDRAPGREPLSKRHFRCSLFASLSKTMQTPGDLRLTIDDRHAAAAPTTRGRLQAFAVGGASVLASRRATSLITRITDPPRLPSRSHGEHGLAAP